MIACPGIDGARQWATLMALAEIGATPAGGVRRLALGDADRQARDRLVAWCTDAGCTVRVDAVGNVFARRPGRDAGRAVVMTGSHLDTQPNGGRFDGAYGVVAGLEVLRTLNDAGVETDAPVELVAWSNEEGTRFAPAMMGSMAHAGLLERRQVLDSTDADGLRYGDELARIGYAGSGLGDVDVAAYFEAHIEQGPVLEARGATIGIVTGGQGQCWYDPRLTGQAAHAGSTPMAGRRDALVGAARVVEAVRRIGAGRADGRATVGRLQVAPNSRNVVPGEVRMTIELRHPDDAQRRAMDDALHAAVHEVARSEGLGFRMDAVLEQPATPFDARCVTAVRDAARVEGLAHLDIVSGAAHDAIAIARIAPAAMVFVPCAGGISHDESESATPADLAAGTQVLLRAMLAACGHPAARQPREETTA